MNLSDNMKGAVFMMVSMAAFVVNDSLMKSLSGEIPLFQAIFLRGVFATLLVSALAARAGVIRWSALAPVDRPVAFIRVCAEIGVTSCFLQALFNMPIANATAILQALPLAITLGGAIFLGEPVGWRRYLAIIAGFTGVLIIVRPGAEGFNAYSIWALGAVVFVVLRDLSTRRLSAHVPSVFAAFLASAAITVTGAVLSPTMAWQPVGTDEIVMLGAAALFLICGYLSGVMTMRVGEISVISPFRYSILIWAIILGIAVFGDVPDGWTLLGSAVVVLTGIYTFYRERKVRRIQRLTDGEG